MTVEQKPFKIRLHYKYDFRDWVKTQFPDLKSHAFPDRNPYGALESRFDEVHSAVQQVLGVIFANSDHVLQEYYSPDRDQLNQAYEKRDVVAYAKHLDEFIDAIEVE